LNFLRAFLLQVVGVEPIVNDAVPRGELGRVSKIVAVIND
jgi:hypothetical protein